MHEGFEICYNVTLLSGWCYWALTHNQCSFIFWMSHVYDTLGIIAFVVMGMNRMSVTGWNRAAVGGLGGPGRLKRPPDVGHPLVARDTLWCFCPWISGLTQNCDNGIAYVVELLQQRILHGSHGKYPFKTEFTYSLISLSNSSGQEQYCYIFIRLHDTTQFLITTHLVMWVMPILDAISCVLLHVIHWPLGDLNEILYK